jgi:hypothetical protein
MQSMAETDLRDLRTRYSDIFEAKSRQDRLIAKLVARLDAAAGYLHTVAEAEGQAPSAVTHATQAGVGPRAKKKRRGKQRKRAGTTQQ